MLHEPAESLWFAVFHVLLYLLNQSYMIILRIEHKVPSFDGWKKAFDSDPINRQKSNVMQHRIYRPVDDPNYVIIDLEFDHVSDATATLAALRNLWNDVEGKIIFDPQTRVIEMVERKVY